MNHHTLRLAGSPISNFSADSRLEKHVLVMAYHQNPHVPGIVPTASWRYGLFENLSRREYADVLPARIIHEGSWRKRADAMRDGHSEP